MPVVRDPVDVESLLVAALGADVGLVAALVDGEAISTAIPADFPDAGAKWLQVFRSGGRPIDPDSSHIDRALVDVHAYGTTDVEAWAVAAKADTALVKLAGTKPVGAVVSATERITGPRWNPDPTDSVPRYTSTWAVTVHPR